MKIEIKRIIGFISLFIIGTLLVSFGFQTHIEKVDCYDYHNSIINGITCDAERFDYPKTIITLFSMFIITFSITITIILKEVELI